MKTVVFRWAFLLICSNLWMSYLPVLRCSMRQHLSGPRKQLASGAPPEGAVGVEDVDRLLPLLHRLCGRYALHAITRLCFDNSSGHALQQLLLRY